MSQLALTKAKVITPFEQYDEATVLIREGKILEVITDVSFEIPAGFQEVSLEGLILAPGLIDQHVHGGGGVEVMGGSSANLASLARYYATHGVTSFLATTISGFVEEIRHVASAFAELNASFYQGARCQGLHLEGPFISPELAGIHNRASLRLPSRAEFDTLQKISGNGIKMITMAPELPGALEFAASLQSEGISLSIGHSNADYRTSIQAVDAGFSCITHCFNQLRPFHHREPGAIGVALTEERLAVEVIADGFHLHPATVQLIWRARGADGIILITDGMALGGLMDGRYMTADGELIMEHGTIHDLDGRLAGSTLTLEKAVKNIKRFTGCTLSDAFRMATYNPARSLGLDSRKGSLTPGKDADIIALTPDLEVVMTMVAGEIISGLVAID